MRRPKTIINCRTCGSELQTYPYLLKRGLGVTCSRKCGAKINRGVIKRGQRLSPTTEFKKGQVSWNKGKSYKLRAIQKVEKPSEEHPFWKGDSAGYYAKHAWVSRHFGKPDKCEKCKTTQGIFEWANMSGTYKREREDWMRLCVKCHKSYDKVWVGRDRNSAGRFI